MGDPLDHSLAFFDIDSLEYAPNAGAYASAIPNLAFRPRMMPLAEQLNSLYDFARVHFHPIVFSACCAGRMPTKEEMPGILHVPVWDSGACWKQKSRGYAMFWVEKAETKSTHTNFRRNMLDKFRCNENLIRFSQALGIARWVVFGNGAAFCVSSALQCLFRAGQKITILSDLLVDSASGYTPEEPAALRLAMLDDYAKHGAEILTWSQFLTQCTETRGSNYGKP
ncbi:MAG TPA: hypothetical protein VLM37_04065 [Fibrobacteraceae bacterium]|nr:hypothetical protein [Fibrobacteraceae bacterium]